MVSSWYFTLKNVRQFIKNTKKLENQDRKHRDEKGKRLLSVEFIAFCEIQSIYYRRAKTRCSPFKQGGVPITLVGSFLEYNKWAGFHYSETHVLRCLKISLCAF